MVWSLFQATQTDLWLLVSGVARSGKCLECRSTSRRVGNGALLKVSLGQLFWSSAIGQFRLGDERPASCRCVSV